MSGAPWAAMTPHERDALIAEKVMGYTLDDEFADMMFEGRPCVKQLRTQDDEWGVLPYYSTDIGAAWQLIDRHPHYVLLVRSNETNSKLVPWAEEMAWRCRFYAPEKFEACAATAPHAICLAALKAIGVSP